MSSPCSASSSRTSTSRTHSLTVLPSTGRSAATSLAAGKHPTIKKSKASRARAIVLTLVHLAIAAHVVQWLVTGLTLSPVEPSESMYALEVGKVNAGAIFFLIGILATLLFGRFFCGWACHIVALQDLCSHLMTRLGVRPKPFRSRLLVWAPFALACYMFLWPTLRREALVPLVTWLRDSLASYAADQGFIPQALAAMTQRQPTVLPWFMGEVAPFPGFRSALMTEDFWATFPPWYVAIPFIAVCTFGIVYFLGSKGFCTYACPYGGFFGPVDRFAPGRIVVNDNCEGCGHCTAVCTSNVRVHQEVRDHGMVVDPGCMKCMDCVSVCPNHALSFGLALPPALGGGKGIRTVETTPSARTRRGTFSLASIFSRSPLPASRSPEFDLTVAGELAFALVAFASFWAFRGFLGMVPMLMAAALGAIHAFCLWKVLKICTVPNVRLQSLQLRVRSRVTTPGAVFIFAVTLFTLVSLWAGFVKFERLRFERIDANIFTPQALAFSRDYTPSPTDKAAAQKALAIALRSGSQSDARALAAPNSPSAQRALGWQHDPATIIRIGWLAAVAGDRPLAERALREATLRGRPNTEVLQGLATLMQLRGAPRAEFEQALQASLAQQPKAQHVRVMLAQLAGSGGDKPRAVALVQEVFAAGRDAEDSALRAAGELQARLGDIPGARKNLEAAFARRPLAAGSRALAAQLAGLEGDHALAAELAREALAIEPRNPAHMQLLAQALSAGNKPQEAIAQLEAWIAAGRATVMERQQLAQLYVVTKSFDKALAILDTIIQQLPAEPGPKLDKAAILRQQGREAEAAAIEASLQAIPARDIK